MGTAVSYRFTAVNLPVGHDVGLAWPELGERKRRVHVPYLVASLAGSSVVYRLARTCVGVFAAFVRRCGGADGLREDCEGCGERRGDGAAGEPPFGGSDGNFV